MSESVKFSDVTVGDTIPVLETKAIDRVQLALFAGASGDHNPIHLDEDAAKGGGLPGCVAHGMLTMAFLGRLLSDWVPQSALRGFSARFTAMAFPGDTITCRGVISAKHDEGRLVDLEILAENQKGERILAGTAQVALP